MTSLFLSPDDLRDLTDTPVKSLQMRWLDDHGWVYTKSRMGNPKVLRAYMERRMGLTADAPVGEASTEPDWSSYASRSKDR